MTIEEILSSKAKPKDKLDQLSKAILAKDILLEEIVDHYRDASTSEKGYLVESLEYVSQEKPEMIEPIVDFVIDNINFPDAPRVRWEAARVIANLASLNLKRLKEAFDPLLENTKDKGTVVRWSAALALTELAKNSPAVASKFDKVVAKLERAEENKGVRNHYINYLKSKS